MDILAHGLWTAAGAVGIKKIKKRPVKVKLSVFFGVFPDIFAFTIITVWSFLQLIKGTYSIPDLPHPSEIEPWAPDTFWLFRLTTFLYSLSHSVIVFIIVLSILYLIKRRFVWEMFGWLFHILIDVFTHSYAFYPTPVFWPISFWRFNGLAWDTPWFIVLNYVFLLGVYSMILRKKYLPKLKAKYAHLLKKDLNLEPARISGEDYKLRE